MEEKKPVREMLQKEPAVDPPEDATSSATSSSLWKWTKKKRRAVKLVIKGWSDVRIASELDVHRATVRRWKDTKEFQSAVISDAHEYTQRTRFKRVHEAGVFVDQFGAQLARTFTQVAKQKEGPSQVQLNALQTLTRGYGDFRNHERADFGDNVRRFEGNFVIGSIGSTNPTVGAAGAQSFKSFVQENMDKIPKGLIESARNPGEALVLATRVMVQETDILDKLYEEEKAEQVREKAGK